MRIVSNSGTDRVVDIVRSRLRAGHRVDFASRMLSLFAFGELAGELARLAGARLVLPPHDAELELLGSFADRAARNRLLGRWLAGRCAAWIEKAVEVRRAKSPVPQGAIVLRSGPAFRKKPPQSRIWWELYVGSLRTRLPPAFTR